MYQLISQTRPKLIKSIMSLRSGVTSEFDFDHHCCKWRGGMGANVNFS